MSGKTELRDSIARLLFLLGLTVPWRRGAGQLSIVTFHRVLPDAERRAYPYPDLAVTPEELDAFLGYFMEHFDCGALATQHERHLGGESTARPLLAVTFDDGQHDNHRYARPVLARHRLKASFFIPVAAIEGRELLWHDRLGFAVLALVAQPRGGRERLVQVLAAAGIHAAGPDISAETVVQASKRLGAEARLRLVDALAKASGTVQAPDFARLMTFEELAELAADGHEIGSHSMTHRMMPDCDDQSLSYELSESRRVLQSKLVLPVESFCFPNGDADERSARAAADAGYRRAVTTVWGDNARSADRFQLRRFDMAARRARGADGKLLPAMVAFRMSGFYPGLTFSSGR